MAPPGPENPEHAYPNESAFGFGESKSAPLLHVCFGLYEVNLQKLELRKRGLKLKLPRQSFQILAMLLERPGHVVSREDLRRALWPSDVFVNFEGSLNSAVQRLRSALQDTSQRPRYIETLPTVGYRFIANIESVTPLSTEAADDAPTAVSADLSVDTPSDELPTLIPPADRKPRPWAAAALLFLIIAVVTLYVGYRHSSRVHRQGSVSQSQPSPVIPHSLTRRSVAIIGFANVSGDARNLWLSTAFAEMLATELAAGDELRMVAGEHVARAKLELPVPSEDSYTTDTLTKIHKDLGCDYVVTGSYVVIGQEENGRLRLDARVQDALTGETVANVAVAGTRKDLFDLTSRAGKELRAKLGAGALSAAESAEVRAALPSSPEAAKLYSEGLAKLRVYDDVEASHLFEKVIDLQPEWSPAYSALASAWSALGYDAKAAIPARKAMELSRDQPERIRLETEARYYKINADWTREIEVYSRLQHLYPDDLDYWINIASAQMAMGKSGEAATTIAALQESRASGLDDPRIELTEAGIAGDLADYRRSRTLAENAARKSEMAGERLLLARAKMMVGYAANNLGDFKGAKEAFTVAQRMCADSGDAVGAALAKMNIGISLEEEGDFTGAKFDYEQALDVFRKKGDQASMAAALTNLSLVYMSEGDLPKAERFIRETMVISSRLNRMGKLDLEKVNLADLLLQQGKFPAAKNILGSLLEHLRSAGEKSLLGHALEILGSIAEAQGDLPTALRMDQEAAGVFKDTSDNPAYADAKRSLGKAFLRAADFEGARRSLSEALSVDRAIGAEASADLDQVELSELSLAQGLPADIAALRSAAGDLRARKIRDGEIVAQIVLARELIRQGKTSEAATALTEAAALAARSYDPTVHFDVALASAHLRIAQHHSSEARRMVRLAQQGAVAIGCVRCEFEGRLELGEIEMQAGNAERGCTQLQQLANEATKLGFSLIAQRVPAACASSPASANLSGRDSRPPPSQ